MAPNVAPDPILDVERPSKWVNLPHVVILGAGASRAAFPQGDANGLIVPLMPDIVDVLGFRDAVVRAGEDPAAGFETIYGRLHSLDPKSPVIRFMQEEVSDYFSALTIPEHATLYDLLLLSLREKDAIFTFNWDPFLVDAYTRQSRHGVGLPQIFHLHGNVRVGFCESCGTAMHRWPSCPQCTGRVDASPLLYPVEDKDYTSSAFLRSQWLQLRDFLQRAFQITIFGYGAPDSDVHAKDALKQAWKDVQHDRLIDRVEIIDIAQPSTLHDKWADLAFHHHYDIISDFFESRLANYPRRSCEMLFHVGFHGGFVKPIAWVGSPPSKSAEQLSQLSLDEARASVANLRREEVRSQIARG